MNVPSVFSNAVSSTEERVRVRHSRETWLSLFETMLNNSLDYEMKADRMESAVRQAAILADVALEAYEERWKS